MKEVLFIQCAGPQGHHEGSDYLVTYLRNALGPGYQVLFPEMPDPENPHYKRWKGKLKKELASRGDKLILVGHSLARTVYRPVNGTPNLVARLRSGRPARPTAQ